MHFKKWLTGEQPQGVEGTYPKDLHAPWTERFPPLWR